MLFVYTCSHTAGTFKNTNILPALASAALTLMNALKKKKKVIFGLKKTKSRVWESGIERFGGGRARHSERSWDVLISVM